MSTHSEAGVIHIETRLTAETLDDLIVSDGFLTPGLQKSIFSRKESLQRILGRGGQMALALQDPGKIIGYAALDFPDGKDRFGGLGKKIVMELTAIEVAPEYRNRHIAKQLLSRLFSDPSLEFRIIYLVSYQWIWDLPGTGLTAPTYHNLLIRLFSDFRFKRTSTNEPNVCLHPENVFMVRMGQKVSKSSQKAFKWLCFGIKPNQLGFSE